MQQFSDSELHFLRTLTTPKKIQDYLDSISYDVDEGTSSPRFVMKDKKANCFEGAIFAAACFAHMNLPPLIVDLMAENDEDHVIAVYKKNGLWGAVAKSNCPVYRFREPIYRSIRELVLTYFDLYFNGEGVKSLRSFSRPINLNQFADKNWMTTDQDLSFVEKRLYQVKHQALVPPEQMKFLSKENVHGIVYQAVYLGSNPDGFYWSNKTK